MKCVSVWITYSAIYQRERFQLLLFIQLATPSKALENGVQGGQLLVEVGSAVGNSEAALKHAAGRGAQRGGEAQELDGGPNERPRPYFIRSFFWARGNMSAFYFPHVQRKGKSSRTTTSTSCVRSPPYPFWELVVTRSYRSYNVFNSQSTLTFSKHGLLQRALLS